MGQVSDLVQGDVLRVQHLGALEEKVLFHPIGVPHRKCTPLGPYLRPLPRVLEGSKEGGRFLMGEVPLYMCSLLSCACEDLASYRTGVHRS